MCVKCPCCSYLFIFATLKEMAKKQAQEEKAELKERETETLKGTQYIQGQPGMVKA